MTVLAYSMCDCAVCSESVSVHSNSTLEAITITKTTAHIHGTQTRANKTHTSGHNKYSHISTFFGICNGDDGSCGGGSGGGGVVTGISGGDDTARAATTYGYMTPVRTFTDKLVNNYTVQQWREHESDGIDHTQLEAIHLLEAD